MKMMRIRMSIMILAIPWLTWSCAKASNPGGSVPDGTGDALPDGAGDVPGDTPADIASDVLDEDGVIPPRGSPFQAETAGGGVISTERYTIELFLAPVRPVGKTSNGNYTIELGPAGIGRP